MLSKLRNHLQSGERLDFMDVDELNNIFHDILWYKEHGLEKPISLINDIYYLFKDIFPYTGVVYRGVCIRDGYEFQHRKEVSSFTNNKNVAENFSNSCDGEVSYLITQNVSEALNLADLLTELAENGILSYEEVGNFIGEDEVLCFIEDSCKVTVL